MLPLLNLGENTAVEGNKRVTPRLDPSSVRIQQLQRAFQAQVLINERLREENELLRDQLPQPAPDNTAALRLAELPFFSDVPDTRTVLGTREVYETDCYLVMPTVANQAGFFQVGFIQRPDNLDLTTAGSFVGTREFRSLETEGPEHLRLLVQQLRLVFENVASKGAFDVPDFREDLPLGMMPNWGSTPEDERPGDVLYFAGFMNTQLGFNPLAHLRMQAFLQELLQDIIIDAAAQGIFFTDTHGDVTTPQYGYLGQMMLPFPGARYRLSLDRDIFLTEATRLPANSA